MTNQVRRIRRQLMPQTTHRLVGVVGVGRKPSAGRRLRRIRSGQQRFHDQLEVLLRLP
jgi:hypothetical protein